VRKREGVGDCVTGARDGMVPFTLTDIHPIRSGGRGTRAPVDWEGIFAGVISRW
jgi:hypothetical protein